MLIMQQVDSLFVGLWQKWKGVVVGLPFKLHHSRQINQITTNALKRQQWLVSAVFSYKFELSHNVYYSYKIYKLLIYNNIIFMARQNSMG